MSTSPCKFTSTSCIAASKPRQYRADIGPIHFQQHQIEAKINELKKDNHRTAQAKQFMCKESHSKMLLMLIAEADNFHAKSNMHVCKIHKIDCVASKKKMLKAGLSLPTLKALVTDVDIVMTDDDKDNYQHALTAVAALSLWQH